MCLQSFVPLPLLTVSPPHVAVRCKLFPFVKDGQLLPFLLSVSSSSRSSPNRKHRCPPFFPLYQDVSCCPGGVTCSIPTPTLFPMWGPAVPWRPEAPGCLFPSSPVVFLPPHSPRTPPSSWFSPPLPLTDLRRKSSAVLVFFFFPFYGFGPPTAPFFPRFFSLLFPYFLVFFSIDLFFRAFSSSWPGHPRPSKAHPLFPPLFFIFPRR